MSTQSHFLVTVTVDGQSIGRFDSFSGGEVGAEPPKHRPGGARTFKTYPAFGSNVENVTVSRVLERGRDGELSRTLNQKVGRATVSISRQPLDDDGTPYGKPTTVTGRLSNVKDAEVDSKSDDLVMLELTVTVEDKQ